MIDAAHRQVVRDLLRCPVCHGRLREQIAEEAGEKLLCISCNRSFDITPDGIPDLALSDSSGLIQKWRSYWDHLAPNYESSLQLMLGSAQNRFRERLVEALELVEGMWILEVGVGTGLNFAAIPSRLRSRCCLFGLDLSLQMLRICSHRCSEEGIVCLLCAGDARSLPFDDGVFDRVLHFGFFNDFPDPVRALEEFVRVVRPGGKVVISDDGLLPGMDCNPALAKLRELNPSFSAVPPIDFEVVQTRKYRVAWFMGLFYILELWV